MPGRCVAGGDHQPQGFNFQLPFNVPQARRTKRTSSFAGNATAYSSFTTSEVANWGGALLAANATAPILLISFYRTIDLWSRPHWIGGSFASIATCYTSVPPGTVAEQAKQNVSEITSLWEIGNSEGIAGTMW